MPALRKSFNYLLGNIARRLLRYTREGDPVVSHALNEYKERYGISYVLPNHPTSLDRELVCDMLSLLANEDHRRNSYPNHLLARASDLSGYGLMSPLHGLDREWVIHPSGVSQNKRRPSVFKDHNGSAYDISTGTAVPVTFPYTPSLKED
jgi:hypothetical protein